MSQENVELIVRDLGHQPGTPRESVVCKADIEWDSATVPDGGSTRARGNPRVLARSGPRLRTTSISDRRIRCRRGARGPVGQAGRASGRRPPSTPTRRSRPSTARSASSNRSRSRTRPSKPWGCRSRRWRRRTWRHCAGGARPVGRQGEFFGPDCPSHTALKSSLSWGLRSPTAIPRYLGTRGHHFGDTCCASWTPLGSRSPSTGRVVSPGRGAPVSRIELPQASGR